MFDTLKTIAVTVVVAIVTTWATVGLVGNNPAALGGETRFPNSTLTAQGLTLSKTGTTSLETGKVCMTVTQVDGDVSYAFFNASGNLATSSTSCE